MSKLDEITEILLMLIIVVTTIYIHSLINTATKPIKINSNINYYNSSVQLKYAKNTHSTLSEKIETKDMAMF